MIYSFFIIYLLIIDIESLKNWILYWDFYEKRARLVFAIIKQYVFLIMVNLISILFYNLSIIIINFSINGNLVISFGYLDNIGTRLWEKTLIAFENKCLCI